MTTIKLKNGSGAPTAGDLVQGEPALDLTNKRLYTEDSGGSVIEVGTNPGTDVTFADNRKAIFGAGSDLQIYHDGSNSYIDENGVGNLFIRSVNGASTRIYSGGTASSNLRLLANSGGEVTLYHSGSAKLATTSTGIDVTGTVTADGLTVEGSSSGTLNNVNFLNTNSGATVTATRIGLGITNSVGASYTYIEANEDGVDAYPHLNFYTGSTATKRLEINNGGDISFYEDTGTTAKLFWDASAERLGIGTSSPGAPLHIQADGTGLRLQGVSPDTNGTILDLYNSSGSRRGLVGFVGAGTTMMISNDESGALAFQTANTERMRIDSSGNVGIRTSSPANLLHIEDSSAVVGTTQLTLEGRYGGYGAGVEFVSRTSSGGTRATMAKITADGESAWNTTASTQDAGLRFSTTEDGTLSERLRINSSGNVGIGTSTPDTLLNLESAAPTVRLAPTTQNNATSLELGVLNAGTTAYAKIDAVNLSTYDTNLRFYTNTSSSTTQVERMRIDSNGHTMFATTDDAPGAGNTQSGVSIRGGSDNRSFFSASSNYVAAFNRNTNNGNVIEVNKDGVGVGSIGVYNGVPYIGYTGGTGGGIMFNGKSIEPTGLTTSRTNGENDIGSSSYRWKDLYLSNQLDVTGSTTFAGYFSTSYDYVAKFESTDSAAFIILEDNASTTDGNRIGVTGDTMEFETAGSEAMRIDASGNLLVGTTSLLTFSTSDTAGVVLENANAVVASRQNNCPMWLKRYGTVGTITAYFYGTSQVGSVSVSASATAYNTSSDQRLKDNIVDAPSASDDIDAIQVRSFDWKADGSHQKYGMVAQELQSVAPNAVTEGDTEEDMMAVDYSKLVPMLVKEIQSLRARVAQLEGEN